MNIKPGMRIKVKDDWRKSSSYFRNKDNGREYMNGIPTEEINPWKIMTVIFGSDGAVMSVMTEEYWLWPLDAIDIVGV